MKPIMVLSSAGGVFAGLVSDLQTVLEDSSNVQLRESHWAMDWRVKTTFDRLATFGPDSNCQIRYRPQPETILGVTRVWELTPEVWAQWCQSRN